MGTDNLELWFVALLPDCALVAPVAVFNCILRRLRFPTTLLLILAVLIAKRQNGFRSIAVCPSFLRMVMKHAAGQYQAWNESKPIEGDTAAPKQDLQKALALRAAEAEIDKACGKFTVTALWDISGYFDEISLARLIEEGEKESVSLP